MKRNCVKCKGRLQPPDAAEIKKAADELDGATSHPPTGPSVPYAVGSALAFLRIFEALANGVCVFCMPPAKWVQELATAGAAK